MDDRTPFDDLPMLPYETAMDDMEVVRSCINASRTLAELKGVVEQIPDHRIILDLLPLLESRLSSEMEGIMSSYERLFLAISNEDGPQDASTKEIRRYMSALLKHRDTMLDKEGIRRICSDICGEDVQYRSSAEDEVKLISSVDNRVVYTPPAGPRVSDLMNNLVEYIYTDDEDPLMKMAVIHYQFESIHPFFDGNGRTGRILNILYLHNNHLLDEPVLFLSSYLIDHRKEYYRLLNNVREHRDWKSWMLFMMEAVRVTSIETLALIRRIMEQYDKTCQLCRNSKLPLDLVNFIFSNPFVLIPDIERALGCNRATASKYLRALENANILRAGRYKKYKMYTNEHLLTMFKELGTD